MATGIRLGFALNPALYGHLMLNKSDLIKSTITYNDVNNRLYPVISMLGSEVVLTCGAIHSGWYNASVRVPYDDFMKVLKGGKI